MSARPAAARGPASRAYAAGARVLSLGIASTGLVTFAYFSLASYALDDAAYTRIALLWAVLFITVTVLYRPIEQLLSRTIAARRALGSRGGHPLRTPLILQSAFAATFVAGALVARDPLTESAFDGSATLYWVLLAGVVAYAASYFARGWLAGHTRFALYGALVFLEAVARCAFAAAVALGVAGDEDLVALGMAAAPLLSLLVVPWALRTATRPPGGAPREDDDLGLARGGRFAFAALAVVLAEQALINGPVLAADAAAASPATAGHVFNALLIARAPVQLFQAVQGSLLPHLAGAHAARDAAEVRRAVRITLLAIAAFAGAVAAALLVAGPAVMDVLFDDEIRYGRWGLALVAAGMGAHLAAGTLTQAALARERAGVAAAAWLASAAAFVAFMALPLVEEPLLRAQTGYAGAATLLCALLWAAFRRRS